MLVKETIKKARFQLCLTQKEFAALFGFDKGVISLYETGRRKPGLRNIKKMCDVLSEHGIAVNYEDLNEG